MRFTADRASSRRPAQKSAQKSAGSWVRRPVALLAAAVSALLVLTGCSIYDAPLPGGASTGKNPMTIKVLFRDVLDLVPQSTVKINDVTVGKITKVDLKGYVAVVTVEVPGDVDLPDNARAEIRQTSLLGEKFVQLEKPSVPGTGKLSNGDTIGLDHTGRNPEVEEVLGALSLLLNGGGVGQLKTIVSEINNTLGGRESEVRSVLDQIRSFMGQLDENKQSIVTALENTNRLALQLKKQDATIKSALDNVPATLRSVNRQRDDLVKLLKSLQRLSGVGVRVIQASKESTINTLRDLAPVLDSFAKAGQNLPKAFQVFLTYPFVDEAVGRDPQVARNLHMGDYTNLSVNLNLSLDTLTDLLGTVCETLDQVRQQVNAGAAQAADQILAPLVRAGLPAAVSTPVRNNLVTKIVDQVLAEAVKQCKAPDVDSLVAFGLTQLQSILQGLTQPLQTQLANVPGVGAVLNTVVSGLGNALGLVAGAVGGGAGTTTGGTGTGTTPGTGSGGGLLGGALGGLTGGLATPANRAALGSRFDKPRQVDPFGLSSYGLDPGIGTMLFQGVAEVR